MFKKGLALLDGERLDYSAVVVGVGLGFLVGVGLFGPLAFVVITWILFAVSVPSNFGSFVPTATILSPSSISSKFASSIFPSCFWVSVVLFEILTFQALKVLGCSSFRLCLSFDLTVP